MSWLAFAASVIGLVSSFIQWLENTNRIDAAVAQAILKGLREADEAIKRAQAARQAFRDSVAANPDVLYESDEFERKD